jgi:hypothetical protein
VLVSALEGLLQSNVFGKCAAAVAFWRNRDTLPAEAGFSFESMIAVTRRGAESEQLLGVRLIAR